MRLERQEPACGSGEKFGGLKSIEAMNQAVGHFVVARSPDTMNEEISEEDPGEEGESQSAWANFPTLG